MKLRRFVDDLIRVLYSSNVLQLFAELPTGIEIPHTPSQYTGGDMRRVEHSGESTQVFLGWEAPAVKSTKDFHTAFLLQNILGGGASFSSGGPGKGMYSRLYSNIMCRLPNVHQVACEIFPYSDSSLIGFSAKATSGAVPTLARALLKEARQLTNSLTTEEVSRAKNRLKRMVSNNLQARGARAEDIARSVAEGSWKNESALFASIDSISVDDCHRVATGMLKSPLTSVAIGDSAALPSASALQAELRG